MKRNIAAKSCVSAEAPRGRILSKASLQPSIEPYVSRSTVLYIESHGSADGARRARDADGGGEVRKEGIAGRGRVEVGHRDGGDRCGVSREERSLDPKEYLSSGY